MYIISYFLKKSIVFCLLSLGVRPKNKIFPFFTLLLESTTVEINLIIRFGINDRMVYRSTTVEIVYLLKQTQVKNGRSFFAQLLWPNLRSALTSTWRTLSRVIPRSEAISSKEWVL